MNKEHQTKLDIRQNRLAHSIKWTGAFAKPPDHSNIYTCMVYHGCTGPFWRMRQSILANALVHFIECASLFWRMTRMPQLATGPTKIKPSACPVHMFLFLA